MFPYVETGDFIMFTPVGTHVVPPIVAPVPMLGTGIIHGAPINVCCLGDELPIPLRLPLPYIDGSFVTPGVGTLLLVPPVSCLSKIRTVLGRPVLLMGPPFPCQFTVTAPAQMPTPVGPVPDPVPIKSFMCVYISKTLWRLSL